MASARATGRAGLRAAARFGARHAEASKAKTPFDDIPINSVWKEYKKTKAEPIRNFLMEKFLPLVRYNAERIYARLPDEVDIEDLMSAGIFGLKDAIAAFDLERKVKFETFCAPRIRGAILDELRRQDHVPRSVRKKARDLNAAREKIARRGSTVPTDQETAAELGVDLQTLWRWQADVEGSVQVPIDGGTSSHDEGAPTPGETLAGEDDFDIEAKLTFDAEVSILRDALMTLSKQERLVLTLYFYEELKLHEIATILELTESRVSQIRSKALGKLRAHMSPLREQVA